MKLILVLLAALECASAAYLTSISGDGFGIPRQFNVIDPATTSAASPFSLGDFTTGFTGGLTYVESTQKYWTIYESQGQVRLASFDSSGPASLVDSALALTAGLWRGLTYAPNTGMFYALYSNGFGPFQLQQIDLTAGTITSLFAAPDAGFGGMTYRSPDLLTALFTNPSGGFQLHSIDLNTQTVTPFGATFNVNMNGGLAWDTTTNVRYFAIGSDNMGNSTLYGIVEDGSAWGGQFGIGGGYFYSALTYHGDAAPLDPGPDGEVPEPSAWLLIGTALPLLAAARRARNAQR
jgi:hypothetical protein